MRDLESFIETIRSDGVEAGRQAAAELQREAELEAARIVEAAKAAAGQIVTDAETQRAQILARGESELSLAARDVLVRLRETISRAVADMLSRKTNEVFANTEFLASLIQDVVRQYARQDAAGHHSLVVTVSDATRQELNEWTWSSLVDGISEEGLSVELREGLAGAGFHYHIDGGTIEITPEAVASVLAEFVHPRLSQLFSLQLEGRATAERPKAAQAG
jgi:V/A-type H+-transporting ATPase subunit E